MVGTTPAYGGLMPWSSTVPAVLAAIIAAFKDSPDLAAPVAVRDGPVVTGSNATDAVIVGWYGMEADDLAVEGQDTPEGLAGEPDREQYTVRCAAMSLDGGGNVARARTRAYELLAACGAAVYADRRLGGLVMRATMGSSSLRQLADEKGLTAIVEFSVDIDAFSGR